MIEAAIDELRQTARTAIAPDPKLSLADWAEERRYLPTEGAAEAGRFRLDRTPYLREPMECLSPGSPVEHLVIEKGAQLGFTEIALSLIGFTIDIAPGPLLMVMPDLETAKDVSSQRLEPALDLIPSIKNKLQKKGSRKSRHALLTKAYPGGTVYLRGARSAIALRSKPIRFLILDDVDGFKLDVADEGDPVSLSIKRTATYRGRRKILEISTPTKDKLSRIHRDFEGTDQRYYFVPCPYCGHYQILRWRGVKWPKDRPQDAYYECEVCSGHIKNHQKESMLGAGEWRPTAPDTSGGKRRGYHLSGLYSPVGWSPTWAEAAIEFVDATHSNDKERLQTFINTYLGEVYKDTTTEVPTVDFLSRRENYGPRSGLPFAVPKGVVLLTAGCDVQLNRIECEVVGWGRGAESWSIDYRIFYGDPADDDKAVWKELEEYFAKPFKHERGFTMYVDRIAVDTGYKIQAVGDFVRPRQFRYCAIKGDHGFGKPLVKSRPSNKNKGEVFLFMLGVDSGKDVLYSRLKLEEPGPGYCHFPIADIYDDEHFKQLVSEVCVLGHSKGYEVYKWEIIRGRRNEVLDCRVYATAALQIALPDFMNGLEALSIEMEKAGDVWIPATRKKGRRKERSSGAR